MSLDLLYEEVHVLALHYHWSEAAILSLSVSKRKRYLGLLSNHLRARQEQLE